MSPNRKADIQRKLALAPVPKPPAGLAERIKGEIPKELLQTTDRDRRRLTQSVAFNIRVAASIILLVGSTYLCITILSRAMRENASIARTERILASPESNAVPQAMKTAPAPAKPATVVADADVAKRQTALDHVAKDAAPAAPSPAPAAPKVAAAVAQGRADERAATRDEEPPSEAKTRKKEATTEAIRVVAEAPPFTAVQETTILAPAAAPAPPAAAANAPAGAVASNAAAPSQPQPEREPLTDRLSKQSADLLGPTSAKAADLAIGKPATLFGIALTSPFAAATAPATAPSKIRIETEAVRAADAAHTMLRVSLDLPNADVPPVGADALLNITFDPKTVREYRALTVEPSTTERVLIRNTSFTALYELDLDPDAGRRAVIATITLHYSSVKDGTPQTVKRVVRVRDVAATWEKASARMKAAAGN